MSDNDRWLTIAELAAKVSCSTSFLYKHHKDSVDPIPVAGYVGERPRFDLGTVRNWLAAGQLNSTYSAVANGNVMIRDRRQKLMARRRHQKGVVQLRGEAFRGLYWRYPEGKRKSVPLGSKDAVTRRQAEKALQEIIDKMEREAPKATTQQVGARGLTVKRYIEDHYMKEIWPNLKPSTKKGYRQLIETRVIPEIGELELGRVSRSDIQLMITNLRPMRNPGHEKLAHCTVKNCRNVLASIFREAELGGYIGRTPVHKIILPPRYPRRVMVLPDVDAVQTIVDDLREPYHTLTWFVATMGCRIGEALGLKWGAVDFEGKVVWFLTARYEGKVEHLTKGHRSDTPVYLTDFEIERLKVFKALSQHRGDDDLVFLDDGKPLEGQHCRGALQKAAKKLGVHLTYHGLRHWAATMLYRAGVPLKDIQARMGHSRYPTTAEWYIENDSEGQRAAAQIASGFLRGKEVL